eukprot:275524-Pleurochrysis_carterae.AAC.2
MEVSSPLTSPPRVEPSMGRAPLPLSLRVLSSHANDPCLESHTIGLCETAFTQCTEHVWLQSAIQIGSRRHAPNRKSVVSDSVLTWIYSALVSGQSETSWIISRVAYNQKRARMPTEIPQIRLACLCDVNSEYSPRRKNACDNTKDAIPVADLPMSGTCPFSAMAALFDS